MADANIRAVITADDRASHVLKGFGNSVSSVGDTVANFGKRIMQVGAAATAAFVTLGVKTAAELESARMGFITLLGSAEKADSIIARIKKEAARTPFEIVGLTKTTQMLSAVTKDGDRALDFILDIGEGLAAMGRGQKELDLIAVNLQQIAATGRAFGIDIRQFATAGIPIYEMLQKEIGLTGEALAKFIEGGGVTFELLEKMFADATSEGGRFFGAFKNQLGTFNQQWSNLKDTFSITAAEIVVSTGLFDKLKKGMELVGKWVTDNKDEIVAFLKDFGKNIAAVAKTAATLWGSLTPATQEFILKLAALALVVMPVVTSIGRLTGAFSLLGVAIRNPAITAVVAFGIAAATLATMVAKASSETGIFSFKTQGLMAALTALAGPIGIIMGYIAALTGKFMGQSQASDQAAQAQNRLKFATDQLNNANLMAQSASLAREQAERNLTNAIAQFGAESLEARTAANQLEQAKLAEKSASQQAEVAARQHSAAERDTAGAMNEAGNAANNNSGKVGGLAGAFQSVASAIWGAIDSLINWNNTPVQQKSAGGGGGGGGGGSFPAGAKGFQNFRGGWALVGEEGPELVNLPKGSDVLPNNETRSLMGRGGGSSGGNTTINVSFSGIFTSNEMEMRRLAEKVFRARADAASAIGMNLSEAVARA